MKKSVKFAKKTVPPLNKVEEDKNTVLTKKPQLKKREVGGIEKQSFDTLPLGRNNFMLMIIAGVMILVGFLLMLGGSSTEESFNPDIFSTRRIVVGPTICFLGFVGMAVAVCIKPRRSPEAKEDKVEKETA